MRLQLLGQLAVPPDEIRTEHTSPEKDWACMRSVNLHVTSGAVSVLRILVMLRASRLQGADVMGHAVAG